MNKLRALVLVQVMVKLQKVDQVWLVTPAKAGWIAYR